MSRSEARRSQHGIDRIIRGAMNSNDITKSETGTADSGEPTSSDSKTIGMPLSLLFIPVLLIAGVVSIPAIGVLWIVFRLQERRFANVMAASNRSMTWAELELAIEREQGTIIAECLSEKGPCRLWWTSENIRTNSPHKYYPENESPEFYLGPWIDPELEPFFEWCYARYTNPTSGIGRLVKVPKEKDEKLLEFLPGSRFVATYSPPRIRKRHN